MFTHTKCSNYEAISILKQKKQNVWKERKKERKKEIKR
jgi:hypothetical protein